MSDMKQLTDTLESVFIYELQHIRLWDAEVQYFADYVIEHLLGVALTEINEKYGCHFDTIDDVPESIEGLLCLRTATIALRRFISDMKEGREKALTLWPSDTPEKDIDAIENLCTDYEESYDSFRDLDDYYSWVRV